MRDWQKTMQQPCRKFRQLLRVRRVAGKGAPSLEFPVEIRSDIRAPKKGKALSIIRKCHNFFPHQPFL
jgi:hypothetical protein